MNSTIFNKKDSYYFNGNYFVYHSYNGKIYKRCLRANEELKSDFPDSIDLKITNKCSHNCWYCHENSVHNGLSFDFDKTVEILKQLPSVPIEIAIGGGNVLEIAPETLKLIDWCNSYRLKSRITINHKDIGLFKVRHPISKSHSEVKLTEKELLYTNICNLVGGVGISLDPDLLPPITKDYSNYPSYHRSYKADIFEDDSLLDGYRVGNLLRHKDNIVFHIIAGLFPIDKLKQILMLDCLKSLGNILILGYKQYGRASNTELPESLSEFEEVIKEFILKYRNDYTTIYNISFDNLALEQLHMKDFFSKDDWDALYLGDDGSCSMYIDAVNGTYAKSSTSTERVSWNDVSLIEFFKSL